MMMMVVVVIGWKAHYSITDTGTTCSIREKGKRGGFVCARFDKEGTVLCLPSFFLLVHLFGVHPF